jgi:hypothetical protein
MERPRRDPVEFGYDRWELVSLEKTSPHPTAYDKWMYLLTGNRIMFVPQECAQKIGTLDPQAGEEFYVRKYKIWRGKKSHTEWDVSQQPHALDHETGIPESDLTRQLRESREIAEKAKRGAQARENVARMPAPFPARAAAPAPIPSFSDVVESTLATDAQPTQTQAIARKPPTVETLPPTQLEHALKTVLYACKTATSYAKEIDYQAPPFTSDDIARMAMTLVIGKEQRR